jgi:hypothetical protein
VEAIREAVSTTETSVNLYQTTHRNVLEDSHLRTRQQENLLSVTALHSSVQKHERELCLLRIAALEVTA